VDIPLDSLPVDATKASNGWCIIPPSSAFYPHKTITFSHTLRDYVNLLPDYDAMLIQRVDFQGLDIYETYDALISSYSLLLVSNGGADNSIGSTGWIVSDDTGRRLVQGSGSVPGLYPRSYRAEGYAMVSGLTVLKHITIFCGRLTLSPLPKLYCNNLGLVKKVSYFSKYRLAPVKCVLHLEYDILFQAFQLLSAYPTRPEILHVKGHQDDKIPYVNLLLPAQLNVDADRLAKRELREQRNLIHHVPLFPSSKVQLLLGGTSVTHNLQGAIRKHQGYQQLVPYMHKRFGWTEAITQSVDWDGFSAAYKTCFKQRKFVFKFCMGLLPTGKTVHRQESRFDDCCPACLSPQESNSHLFQCPSLSRQGWRAATTSTLCEQLELHQTNPILVDIMTAGLDSYFQNKTLVYDEFSPYDDPYVPRQPYYRLLQHQDQIGWDHFLQGKLSYHWTRLQQDFIWCTSPGTTFDRDKWLRLIIKPL
jgi:hypothetical protein